MNPTLKTLFPHLLSCALAGALYLATPADLLAAEAPSASAARAEVPLMVSPRERLRVFNALYYFNVDGEVEHDSLARVTEVLSLDAVRKAVIAGLREGKGDLDIERSFSEKPEKVSIARDDAGRLAKWLSGKMPANLASGLETLRRALQKIASP